MINQYYKGKKIGGKISPRNALKIIFDNVKKGLLEATNVQEAIDELSETKANESEIDIISSTLNSYGNKINDIEVNRLNRINFQWLAQATTQENFSAFLSRVAGGDGSIKFFRMWGQCTTASGFPLAVSYDFVHGIIMGSKTNLVCLLMYESAKKTYVGYRYNTETTSWTQL